MNYKTMRNANLSVTMKVHMYASKVTPAVKRIGVRLRATREAQGLTTHALAKRAGVSQTTVTRFEQGAYANPDAAKLAALAESLGLDAAEVMATARYPLSADVLSPSLYLRAKYRDLPPDQLADVQREVAHVLRRHGIETGNSPAPGEDEAPDHHPSP